MELIDEAFSLNKMTELIGKYENHQRTQKVREWNVCIYSNEAIKTQGKTEQNSVILLF